MVDEKHDGKELTELQELERALSTLKPAGSGIDRDRFLFLAGQAAAGSARPRSSFGRWAWPASTLVSSAAVVVLAVLLVTRTEPAASVPISMNGNADRPHASDDSAIPASPRQDATDRIASVTESVPRQEASGPARPETESTPSEAARELAAHSNYPRLRSFVLAYGVEALPEPAPIAPPADESATGDKPRTQRAMLRQLMNDSSMNDGSTDQDRPAPSSSNRAG